MNQPFLLLSLFLLACSSTTSTTNNPAPEGDASTSTSTPPKTDGGPVTPDDNLLACASQPPPTSALVAPQLLPTETAPSPAGGAVSDGTYHLAAVKAYGTAANALYASIRLKEKLEVGNGAWRIAYHYEAPSQQNVDGAHAGTFAARGTILGGEETCDDGDASNGIGGFLKPFTATGASLDIFEDEEKQIVFTYTKD